MSLPKILPISWSLSDDRNHQAAVPICSTAPSPFVAPVEACMVEAIKGVADFRRPGDSLPTDLNNLNNLNSSNNNICTTCIAHEITNWLPAPDQNVLSASPCSPCLRGSSSNNLNSSNHLNHLNSSNHLNYLNNLNSSNHLNHLNTWPLTSLETFFAATPLQTTPIALNPHTTIHDLPKFISTHLSILNRYPGTREFLPYLHRLLALKNLLSNL